MSIGDNIKRLRESRNLKQSDLADMLGVSDKTISSWEINRTEPKMGMVERISIALNCKKTDIIGISEQELTSKDPKDHISSMIKKEYGVTTHKAFSLLVRLDDLDKEKTIERMEVYLEDEKYMKQKGILEA